MPGTAIDRLSFTAYRAEMAVRRRLSTLKVNLESFRFHYASEADLQAAVLTALTRCGYAAYREWRLGRRDAASGLYENPDGATAPSSYADRPDLFIPAIGIAVEVKVDGGASEVARQLARYAQHEEVEGVLLVTTRPGRHCPPPTLAGKPVAVFGVVSL